MNAPTKRQRSNGSAPTPPATGIPQDTMLIMSRDGGDTFVAGLADGCTVSRYAWPTILRSIADRLEAELRG